MSPKKKHKKHRRPPLAARTSERSGCPTALVTQLQFTQIILTLLRILVDR